MNIYERLIKDHDKQEKLANRLMETSGDSAERRELFILLKAEATNHANAEEQTLYSVLMEHPDGQEQSRHSVAEHKEADDLLEQLSEMDMSSAGWIQKFEKFRHELLHHIAEEERDVFPLAKKLIDEHKASEMAELFDKRKRLEELA